MPSLKTRQLATFPQLRGGRPDTAIAVSWLGRRHDLRGAALKQPLDRRERVYRQRKGLPRFILSQRISDQAYKLSRFSKGYTTLKARLDEFPVIVIHPLPSLLPGDGSEVDLID